MNGQLRNHELRLGFTKSPLDSEKGVRWNQIARAVWRGCGARWDVQYGEREERVVVLLLDETAQIKTEPRPTTRCPLGSSLIIPAAQHVCARNHRQMVEGGNVSGCRIRARRLLQGVILAHSATESG